MSRHESTGIETEVKIPIEDPNDAQRRILSAGFREIVPRSLEVNIVLDLPGQPIRGRGELLRVRSVMDRTVLTYKGKAQNALHKSREELEVDLSDFRTSIFIFERLGFSEIFRYEKYRTEFAADESGLVLMDETPIGAFLELEGDPRWIDKVAALLGFTAADYVTASYGALYVAYCKSRGQAPGNMVFGA